MKVFWAVFMALIFFGALFWAKSSDPFERKWFTIRPREIKPFACCAVMPKPLRRRPVVIYVHDSSDSLNRDGVTLRQIAELGLAAVSLDCNQTNDTAFSAELASLLKYLGAQSWVDGNEVAWVGFGMGANRILNFALQHPLQQPRVLIQLGGTGLHLGQESNRLSELHSTILNIDGDQDANAPVVAVQTFIETLKNHGLVAEFIIIPNVGHSMDPMRGIVFRRLGEYCLVHLLSRDPWTTYHSIGEWREATPNLFVFWTPALAWAIGWLVWFHRQVTSFIRSCTQRFELKYHLLATIFIAGVAVQIGIRVVLPRSAISERTLVMAKRWLVRTKDHPDLDFLAEHPIWQGKELRILLENVELATYNRQLINWRIDESIFRESVLVPVITGEQNENFDWRRLLWEEFYTRIRHENSPEEAAEIVGRHLSERVTVAAITNASHNVRLIWRSQITDPLGFEIIYVAALRSVGVPARLDLNGRAEISSEKHWRRAPHSYCLESLNEPTQERAKMEPPRRDEIAHRQTNPPPVTRLTPRPKE